MTENFKEATPAVSLVANTPSPEGSDPTELKSADSNTVSNPREQVGPVSDAIRPAGSDSAVSAQKEKKLPVNEKNRDGKAKSKNLKVTSVAILTALMGVCLGIGFWAGTKSPAGFAAALPNSPLSKVHPSKTIEGYEEQALIAFGKNDIPGATDAWQQEFDRAAFLNFTAPAVAKLYMNAGDTVSSVTKDDGIDFRSATPSPQYRALAKHYYSKALALYISEKLPRQELKARYRLAALSAPYDDVNEGDNLRAIISLDKENARDPSWRLERIYYSLGLSLDEEGQYDEAAIYLEKAIRTDKHSTTNVTSTPAYMALSRILRIQHRVKDLISLLKFLEDRRAKGLIYEQPATNILQELKAVHNSVGDWEAGNKIDLEIKRVLQEQPK